MRASRSARRSLSLLSLLAIAPLACGRAEVNRPEGAAAPGNNVPGGGPGGSGGGFNLPGGGPANQGGAPGGAGAGSPGAPMEPAGQACAKEVHGAERVPVDLLLLLDASGSMQEAVEGGTRLKGELVREALLAFIEDPRSAGLGVGLQFFPVPLERGGVRTPMGPCQSNADCAVGSSCEPGRLCWGTPPRGSPGPTGPCLADIASRAAIPCPYGGMCVDNARCAMSGNFCHPAGQLCPGGRPGDVCQPVPRQCISGGRGFDSCQVSVYEKPAVPIAALPGAEGPLAQALQNQGYSFGTPMGPALVGALAQARAHRMANPSHHVALVLATDGFPESCEPSDAAGISALVAGGLMQSPPISTYAIGVFGVTDAVVGRPLLEAVATAGGTGKPFVLNSDPNLVQSFQDALVKIREQSAIACEFGIPRPNSPIDFAKVNVRVQDAAGTGEDIPNVPSADRCDPMKGGWYYDVDPATAPPTRVLACPATCSRLKAQPAASVSLVFGCKTLVID